jgi:hypothetical protein
MRKPIETATHYDVTNTYHSDVLVKSERTPVWFQGMDRQGHFVYQTQDGQEFWTLEPLETVWQVHKGHTGMTKPTMKVRLRGESR